MSVLREDLLAGRRVRLSGSVGAATKAELERLGATIVDPADAHSVVHDAGADFDEHGLTTALAGAWSAVAEVANASLIPQGRGKVILIAPRPNAGEHAEAARAGLENLVRTLSTEWARYQITTIAI